MIDTPHHFAAREITEVKGLLSVGSGDFRQPLATVAAIPKAGEECWLRLWFATPDRAVQVKTAINCDSKVAQPLTPGSQFLSIAEDIRSTLAEAAAQVTSQKLGLVWGFFVVPGGTATKIIAAYQNAGGSLHRGDEVKMTFNPEDKKKRFSLLYLACTNPAPVKAGSARYTAPPFA